MEEEKYFPYLKPGASGMCHSVLIIATKMGPKVQIAAAWARHSRQAMTATGRCNGRRREGSKLGPTAGRREVVVMPVRGRPAPPAKLHKEDWVLRKVRKGKLGLGSVKRGRDPATSVAVTRSPIVTSMYIPTNNIQGRYLH